MKNITRLLLFNALLIVSIILITRAEDSANQSVKFSEELIQKERSIEIARKNIDLTDELQFNQSGISSFYGNKFHNRKTSSGEIYHSNKYSAAHRFLPFGSIVRVINKLNGKSTLVVVNDRGPFIRNRIIDISAVAAQQIGSSGIPPVQIQTLLYKSELANNFEDVFFTFSLNLEPLVLSQENLIFLQVYDNFSEVMKILNELQQEHNYINYCIALTPEDYSKAYPKEKRSYYLAIITPQTLITMNL